LVVSVWYAGHKLREKDVIELKTGGTGFIARDGDRVMAEKWVVTPLTVPAYEQCPPKAKHTVTSWLCR
jgi:hypothetical protein